MFALHLVSVLATLLSITAAAPTTDDCSQLTRNLTASEFDQILGTWILIEGFSNNDLQNSILENMESAWMRVLYRVFYTVYGVNTTADNLTLLVEQAMPVPGGPSQSPTPEKVHCIRPVLNGTITDDSSLENHLSTASVYHKFLRTCPECLVMFTYNKVNDYQMLCIYGRNKTVAASDLETFRKQATCLQFPQPPKFHYDPSKELCPM